MKQKSKQRCGLLQFSRIYKLLDIELYKDYFDSEDFTTYDTVDNDVGFIHLNYWVDIHTFWEKEGYCFSN